MSEWLQMDSELILEAIHDQQLCLNTAEWNFCQLKQFLTHFIYTKPNTDQIN